MLSPIRKPCGQPGCRNLVIKGRCAEHATSKYAEGRETAARRGYDRHHQRWRREILARDPICKECGQEISTEAHHIIPISKGGARFALENGRGLGKSCHSRITARENAGYLR